MTVADASIYTDFSGLTALKGKAARNPEGALDEVTRQFESLFLQQMIKEMRKAKLADGIFDSSQSQFYRDMYDQQLALHLSKSGGLGLAEVLKRQLSGVPGVAAAGAQASTREVALAERQNLDGLPLLDQGGTPGPVVGALQGPLDNRFPRVARSVTPVHRPQPVTQVAPYTGDPSAPFAGPEEFVQRLMPHAREAAAMLGVEPDVLIAQAALESGWGSRQFNLPNGQPAYNLFGIKADLDWDGKRVAVSTLEYEDGVAVRRREPFRAYDSYRESFLDYASFIVSNPRYGRALQAAQNAPAYFRELQRAGYATDPDYAGKLSGILNGKYLRNGVKAL